MTCEAILAAHFQFFCLFCLILEKKVVAPNESKLAQAILINKQLLITILPLHGEKIEKKVQKKATLLAAQYHKTKV